MHVTRTLTVEGDAEQALASIMKAMLQLEWDIEASAPLWVRASSGSWWEKKVDVEVVVTPSVEGRCSVMIDAEPKSAVPIGPAWEKKVQEAVSELSTALGAPVATAAEPPVEVKAVKVPLTQEKYDPGEWKEMNDAADDAAPLPAPVTESMNLAMQQREPGGGGVGGGVGAGGAALPVGKFLKWVVKEVGSALVAIGVQSRLDDEPEEDNWTKYGKLEYQVSSNQMLIRWKDGSATLAPKEYQPGG